MERQRLKQAFFFLVLACASAALAVAFRPTMEMVAFGDQKLKDVIPANFGDWRIDTSITPVLPDPSVMRAIDRIYSETLARTYVNKNGQRIMLSMAYGKRQDETMRVHQPEGCYAGQGFAVTRGGVGSVQTVAGTTPVMRLNAVLGQRREPITYWMVVGGRHAVSQWQGKLAQLSFGVRGFIPDGMLVRISSISGDPQSAYTLHDAFSRELLSAIPAATALAIAGK